jgi:hypothetical protein
MFIIAVMIATAPQKWICFYHLAVSCHVRIAAHRNLAGDGLAAR